MKSLVIFTIMLFTGINVFALTVQESIESANKSGLTVFLVITDPGNANTQQAMDLANQAHAKYQKSEVVQMNRSDAANKDLVAKYGVANAPLPLILVIANNGVVTGGFVSSQATADLLVKSIPSPAKAVVMKALSDGKSVFLVVSRKNMAEKNEVMTTCQKACLENGNNTKLIPLDLDDPKEVSFITELQIDQSITSPQTYVINSKGQITGKYDADVNTTELVASAQKLPAPKGGCCPGGSGAGCGPKK